MIIVDTSVWIGADRHPVGPLARALRSLGEADEIALALPVRLELAAGPGRRNRKAFLRRLTGLPVVVPTEDTWRLVERWIPMAADKGQRFSLADLMIAALADDIGALVWSLDEDFERLERLKLVRTYSV